MDDTRMVEILKNGVWKETLFQDLKKGDEFRMFEPNNGDLFKFKCESDAYLPADMVAPVWTVDVATGPSYCPTRGEHINVEDCDMCGDSEACAYKLD